MQSNLTFKSHTKRFVVYDMTVTATMKTKETTNPLVTNRILDYRFASSVYAHGRQCGRQNFKENMSRLPRINPSVVLSLFLGYLSVWFPQVWYRNALNMQRNNRWSLLSDSVPGHCPSTFPLQFDFAWPL